MPDHARITSLDALEDFRSHLIVYLEKAMRAVAEIDDDITGTRQWLQSDRRVHWEAQVRRRAALLDQRKQELFTAQLSSLRHEALLEQAAVKKAEAALAEAETKLHAVKQYSRQYENRIAPLATDVERIRGLFQIHMRQAVATLTQQIQALQAYAEVRKSVPVTPVSETETPVTPATGGKP